MDTFEGEEKNSLHYEGTGEFTQQGAEQFVAHSESSLGGGVEVLEKNKTNEANNIDTASARKARVDKAVLTKIRHELHELKVSSSRSATKPGLTETKAATSV